MDDIFVRIMNHGVGQKTALVKRHQLLRFRCVLIALFVVGIKYMSH